MISDSIQDSTRYVVKEIHHGSIMPGLRAEMQRDVFLLPGADIRGGIWGNNLIIEGPKVKVNSSIYAKGAVKITKSKDYKGKGKESEVIQIKSSIASNDSIVIEKIPFKVRFMSDVYTDKLHLRDSIVYGNVFSNNAIIENSIVLGGIFCKENLEISNSMVSTFRSKVVNLLSNVFLFFPYAIADEKIELKEVVRAITFLNIYEDIKGKKKDSKKTGGIIEMDEDDIIEAKADEILGVEDEKGTVKLLSTTERILNTKEIKKHFEYNKKFLEAIALRNHYISDAIDEKFNKSLDSLERRLWKILREKKINRVEGFTKIDKIFEEDELENIFKEILEGE